LFISSSCGGGMNGSECVWDGCKDSDGGSGVGLFCV